MIGCHYVTRSISGGRPLPRKCGGLFRLRSEGPSLAFMDDLERIPVRIKYIGGVVSRIVLDPRPR